MQAVRHAIRKAPALSQRRIPALKPTEFGQPRPASHPHLFAQEEVTPGISLSEYDARRKRLMDSLPDNSVVVSVAAPVKYMSKNIFYKYRQNSDFWYLTGFEEPDSALVLGKETYVLYGLQLWLHYYAPKPTRHIQAIPAPIPSQQLATSSSAWYPMSGSEMIIWSTSTQIPHDAISLGTDLAKAKWDGARTSFQDVETIFGADNAVPITSFASQLRSILSQRSHVYVDIPNSTTSRRSTTANLLKYLTASVKGTLDSIADAIPSSKRVSLGPEVAKLRHVKSEAEQAIMHQAATISGRAHAKTMKFTEPGKTESALAAHFEYICALNGAQRPAYVPVVGSGANALTIHYTSNNQVVDEGEMVLIDAGCEFNGYASDITRTYPASGTFSPAQRDLYEAVLSAQKQLVTYCFEGANISMQELHRLSVQLLRQALNQIGFQLGSEGDLERVLYPHYLSHPIGIDLHESTYFERHTPLKAGNVVTIEPGVYVPPTANFPKHFHNIGIRIEDEVLVGKEAPLVLSTSAPKEIEDVEGACQGLLGFEAY
ncbi:peptidase M24 [Coprinopsis sp. MPI-PUGE-AT-0042]|nr:peptidase M24 [Coprinopsis sp. MPI-PUGE-AT-0042]